MYLESVEDDNMVYSVDMIRLKTYITFEKFSELEFLINSCYKDKIKKMWFSDKIMCFHYNYTIEVEEGRSFYFGFHCNNEKFRFYESDGTSTLIGDGYDGVTAYYINGEPQL